VIKKSSSAHGLEKYLLVSLVVHLLAVFLLLIAKTIQSGKQEVRFVESVVRVDIVGMPTHTVQELKNIAKGDGNVSEDDLTFEQSKKQQEEQEVAKKEEVSQNAFLASIQKHAQKEIKVSRLKKEKVPDKKKVSGLQIGTGDKKNLTKLLLAGNKISQGSALVNDGRSGSRLEQELDQYAAQTVEWVRPHWRLPSYLQEKLLRCRVQLFLRPDGHLIKATFKERSGNREYDQRALQAVKDASPYPTVGDQISSRVIKGGIILGFPL